jgi:ribosomal protection tetracycline resistance protein
VTDCSVSLTRVGYEPPMSSAADFRNLTPMVLNQALQAAGSEVYEPSCAIEVEAPDDSLTGVLGALTSLGADIAHTARADGSTWTVRGQIPARTLQDLAIALPGLTHGEGTLWYEPGSDRRVRGRVPTRQRLNDNRA